jgi:hypothetical protein
MHMHMHMHNMHMHMCACACACIIGRCREVYLHAGATAVHRPFARAVRAVIGGHEDLS